MRHFKNLIGLSNLMDLGSSEITSVKVGSIWLLNVASWIVWTVRKFYAVRFDVCIAYFFSFSDRWAPIYCHYS